MPSKTLVNAHGGKEITLTWGGDRLTGDDEVLIDPPRANAYFNGPALRDALLEAFPLPKGEPLADWEKELLAGVKPKPSVVPGQVWRSGAIPSFLYTVLPDGKYYAHSSACVAATDEAWDRGFYDLVFDPRGAKALPSPLGIRVGDRVRKVYKDGDVTTTVEFEVHLLENGLAHPRYGVAYGVRDLAVTSREVPDRLPAGTVVRLYSGDLRLITNEGGIHLTGYVNPRPDHRDGSDYGRLVKDGDAEVIYLP